MADESTSIDQVRAAFSKNVQRPSPNTTAPTSAATPAVADTGLKGTLAPGAGSTSIDEVRAAFGKTAATIPARVGVPKAAPAAAPQDEGFIGSTVHDITAAGSLLKDLGMAFLRDPVNMGVGNILNVQDVLLTKGDDAARQMLEEQARGAAFLGSFAGGSIGRQAAVGIIGPAWAKSMLGRAAVRAAEGVGFGAISGLPKGKPVQEAVGAGATMALLPPVAAGLVKGAQGAVNGVLHAGQKFVTSSPAVYEALAPGIERAKMIYDYLIQNGETKLRNMGLGNTVDRLMQAREEARLLEGQWSAAYRHLVSDLSPHERRVMGGIVEGKLDPTTNGAGDYLGLSGMVAPGREPAVVEATARYENLFKTVGGELQAAGVPAADALDQGVHSFQLRDDYLPHRTPDISKYLEPSPLRNEAVQAILKSAADTRAMANDQLDQAMAERRVLGQSLREGRQQIKSTVMDLVAHAKQAERVVLKEPVGTDRRSLMRYVASYIEKDKQRDVWQAIKDATPASFQTLRKLGAELRANTSQINQARELLRNYGAKTEDDALAVLQRMADEAKAEGGGNGGMYSSPAFRARTIGLPGYEMDPDLITPQYLETAARRVVMANRFGPQLVGQAAQGAAAIPARAATPEALSARTQYPRAFEELDQMLAGPQRDAAERTISDQLGKSRAAGWFSKNVANKMMALQYPKLALSAIVQLSQILNHSVVYGMKSTIEGMFRQLSRDPEAMDYAIRTGVGAHGAVRKAEAALLGGASAASEKALRVTGFTAADEFSREVDAQAGRMWAEAAANKWAGLVRAGKATTPDAARLEKKLMDLNLDPQQIMAQGGRLSKDQLLSAGLNASSTSNYWSDALSLPEVMISPSGRFFTQFKSFAYQQSALMQKHILGPAFEYIKTEGQGGDIQPLLRWAAISPTGGEAIADIRALVSNRQRPADTRQRIVEDLTYSVGFGVLSDAIRAIESGASGTLGFIAGPSAGQISKAADALGGLSKGDPQKFYRFMLRDVLPLLHPSAGMVTPALENAVVPSDANPPLVSAQ